MILDTVDLIRRKSDGIALGELCVDCNVGGGIQIPDLGSPAPAMHMAKHVTAYESFIPEEQFGPIFLRNIVVQRETVLQHPDFPDLRLERGTYQIRRRRTHYPRRGSSDPSWAPPEAYESWPEATPALHALDCYDRGPRIAPNEAAIEAALRRRLLAFDLPDRPIHVVKGPLEAYRLIVGQQTDPDWDNRLRERTPPIHEALIGASTATASADHFPPSVYERLEILASNKVTWADECQTGLRDWIALGFDRSVSAALADIANCVLALFFTYYSDQREAPLFPSDLSLSITDIDHPSVVLRLSMDHAEFKFDRDYLQCIFSDGSNQVYLSSLDIPFPDNVRHLAFIDALWSDLAGSESGNRVPSTDFLDAYLNGLGGVVVTPDRVIAITQPALAMTGCELTSTTGPAVRWASGEKQWFIDSERVPGWVIERPEAIKLTDIRAEEEVFVREAMIERYRGASGAVGVGGLIEDHGGVLSRSGDYSLQQVTVGVGPDDIAKVLRWCTPAIAKGRAPEDRYYRVPIRVRSVRQADDWTLGFGKFSKRSRNKGMPGES